MKHLHIDANRKKSARDGEWLDMVRLAIALVLIMFAVLGAADRLGLTVGAQETGEIRIVKIICEGEGEASLTLADSQEAAATPPKGCVEDGKGPIKGVFLIFEQSSQDLAADAYVDVESGVATASLPPGEYEVFEDDGSTVPSVAVTVVAGEITVLQSVSYTERAPDDLCAGALGDAEAGGPEPVVEDGPRIRWKLPLPAAVSTTVIGGIAEDLLAIALNDHRSSSAIIVLETGTGTVVWCSPLNDALPTLPVVTDGVVVVTKSGLADQAETIAFDGASGRELWRFTPGLFAVSPGAAGSRIFAGLINEERTLILTALDTTTGEEIWSYPLPPGEEPMPVLLTADAVYVATNGYEDDAPSPAVTAFDPATDQELWRSELPLQGGTRRGIADADGTIYLSVLTGEGSCCMVAIDAETGAERWTSDAIVSELATPLIADGAVYAGGSGGFVALDAATGDELWRADLGGVEHPVQSDAVLLGDQLVVTDSLGSGAAGEPDLVGLDPETGEVLWRLPLGVQGEQFDLVVADGALFVAADELMALELGESD